MHNLLHLLWHATEHTLIDTLRLLPFLFLTYLLMEFLEHKSGDAAANWLRGSGRIGPLLGGAMGVLPQCGFSAAASGLYTGRIITTGTLLAVYLSTSDEMLPILISEGAPLPLILKLLATKLIIGVGAGFLVDLVSRLLRTRSKIRPDEPCIEELCEREGCDCHDHFALSALKHTLRIALFLLIFSFFMNLGVEILGEERLASLMLNRPVLGSLLASLAGLIPNCASSILLTKLYLEGVMSVGAMLSGLLVNAGVGLALLFKNNRPMRDSFRILLLLLVIGVLCGILIDLTPIASLF